MLITVLENMGVLCSKNRHYTEADAEENAQVNTVYMQHIPSFILVQLEEPVGYGFIYMVYLV